MDIYQQIAELTAELQGACLTTPERAATIRQLHELQRDIELAEVEAIDSGHSATATVLFDQWSLIESALVE